MNVKKITNDFSAGPQPTLEEIEALASLGFKSLMVNRPEGEEPGQPSFDAEAAAAAKAGVQSAFVPLVPGQLTPQLVAQFKAAYDTLPKPIFAHCQGGKRSVMLWAMSQKGERSSDEIIQLAAEAGFDISQLRPMLTA